MTAPLSSYLMRRPFLSTNTMREPRECKMTDEKYQVLESIRELLKQWAAVKGNRSQ